MSAKRFFESAIPHLVASRMRAFAAQRGRIAVHVAGEGSWTVALGDLELPVRRGAQVDAELTLWMSGSAFSALVAEDADGVDWSSKAEIRHQGDAELLMKFGRFLTAPQGLLGARLDRGDARPRDRAQVQAKPRAERELRRKLEAKAASDAQAVRRSTIATSRRFERGVDIPSEPKNREAQER